MDLSFTRFERDVTVSVLPSELAVLMVGIASRQAASPTARVQALLGTSCLPADALCPRHGAFNRAVAAALRRWDGG